MSTHRASNLGNLFNARRVADRPAQAPEATPYTVRHSMPESAPSTTPEFTRETARESTVEPTQDLTHVTVLPATTADPQEDELVVSNVAIYLPAPVLDRLKRERGRRKMTYTDLLVMAFDELSQEQLLEALGYKPQGSGMPRRRGAGRGQGGIQVQLRLDQLQRSWLDQQVQALGAPSRSALVAAVFDFWLPKR